MMKTYTPVARKTVTEDRIAICPKFGCEIIKKIKPLKFRFIGFGKYPKCKRHHIPLVYVDERITDFVDGALACLFDIAGLPPKDLLSVINSEDLEFFVQGWIYCITIGKGAPIISKYIDSITKTYLKQLTRKQLKILNNPNNCINNDTCLKVNEGMQEISKQYTRLLKHLRIHSEILSNVNNLKPLSINLRNILNSWVNLSLKKNQESNLESSSHHIPLSILKQKIDNILNIGICKCLLGLSPEEKNANSNNLTAFERFSAYYEFYTNNLTRKFTKNDIERIISDELKKSHPAHKDFYFLDKNTSKKEVNKEELILIFHKASNSYELIELNNTKITNLQVIGLDKNDQLKEIDIKRIIKTDGPSYNITCNHGILSLTEENSLFTVDDELNILKISVKNVQKGIPILIPRIINVVEDHSPLDFGSLGEICEENGKEYVRKERTKAFRFVQKNFDLGYILGQYCAEGFMNGVTISCGNDKKEMEKVAELTEKVFGYKPFITKHNKEHYKPIFNVDSNSILIKKIFNNGLGLKPKHAPFKEIPPFLYNAPLECVKGFIYGFTKGDGSLVECIRKRNSQSSPSRDISYRLSTSSRKLLFGLNFLLKRLGIIAGFHTREFDDNEHPTWHNEHILHITGKYNLSLLRDYMPSTPEYGMFARDITPEIDLNPWMKKLNIELKEMYNISLRNLSEKKKIPYIAARCAQENSKMNISEAKMIETINFLKKSNYVTPLLNKLNNFFSIYSITKVKSVEKKSEINDTIRIISSYSGTYIAGIGHIFIN